MKSLVCTVLAALAALSLAGCAGKEPFPIYDKVRYLDLSFADLERKGRNSFDKTEARDYVR